MASMDLRAKAIPFVTPIITLKLIDEIHNRVI